jgi:ATP-dependent DNA helicase RecQ
MSNPEIEQVARETFGFETLRPGQREAIGSLLEGRDTLVVMSTGSGKSAIYEIAGFIKPGVTVVISPLAAPRRDPVEDYLFLAPEQLADDEVLAQVRAADPTLIVIDEAHCISERVPDFRPDYLRLGAFIAEMGHPPVLALTTATAPPVREQIVDKLHLHDPVVVAPPA